jgi:hypothetical protein
MARTPPRTPRSRWRTSSPGSRSSAEAPRPAAYVTLRARARNAIARRRFSLLLAALCAGLFVSAGTGGSTFGPYAADAFLILIIVGAAAATEPGRTHAWTIAGLLAFHVALTAVGAVAELGPPLPALRVLAAGLTAASVVWLTLEEIFFDRTARGADALAGAAFGFLLIGVGFALIYTAAELAHPGSFEFDEGGGADAVQLVYFSLVTLTTTGFGDVTAKTPLMRLTSAMEAVVGTLYLAILVGRLLELAYERRAGR